MNDGIPPLLQKAIVTVLAGGIAYGLTSLVGGKGPDNDLWKLTLSVFIGGATFMLQYLHQVEKQLRSAEKRFDKHALEVKDTVGRGIERVNDSARLLQMLEDSSLPTDQVKELVTQAAQFLTSTPEIVHAFAQSEVTRLAKLVHDLRSGVARYPGEDHDWLLTLTRSATRTIDATSTSIDQAFWGTELGKSYLRAQQEAINVPRRVVVRRLFIVGDDQSPDDPVVIGLRTHQSALGIDVRVVSMTDLDPKTKLEPKYNFIVFDDAVSYEMSLAVGEQPEPEIETTLITLLPEEVRQRKQRFETLWNQGT
ncbi:hypothetical protein [Streptomyces sp. NPDC048442]|uniref:hypothetical protein n=1 Tax=Streptomyces sp. NPDC048442 TaxID=3154823 RepID=UPI003417A34F